MQWLGTPAQPLVFVLIKVIRIGHFRMVMMGAWRPFEWVAKSLSIYHLVNIGYLLTNTHVFPIFRKNEDVRLARRWALQ